MDLQLKGKKVLVTGGSRGIGKAIAASFLKEGADVGIVARTKYELEEVSKELDVRIYTNDLTNVYQREQLITDFITDFNGIDILINNAGASYGKTVSETSPILFHKTMNLNFIAAVHLSQLVSQHMITQGEGVIINISSIYGKEAGGVPAYNASKAALNSFTKSFSSEVIKYNIRVVGIAPGAIFHPNKEWTRRIKNDPDFLDNYAKSNIPAGRLGKPEEVGNIAVFLASNKAAWIVGSTISVDGGQSRMNY